MVSWVTTILRKNSPGRSVPLFRRPCWRDNPVATRFRLGQSSATLLLSLLQPPPAILVLGAGLDAEPVVRFANELGWRVTVQDHRPAYIQSGDFVGAEQIHCVPVDEFRSP